MLAAQSEMPADAGEMPTAIELGDAAIARGRENRENTNPPITESSTSPTKFSEVATRCP